MLEILLVIIVALIIYLIYNNNQLTKDIIKQDKNIQDKDIELNKESEINNIHDNFVEYNQMGEAVYNPYIYDRSYNPYYFPYYSYYSYEPRPVPLYNTSYKLYNPYYRNYRYYNREYNHLNDTEFKRGDHHDINNHNLHHLNKRINKN